MRLALACLMVGVMLAAPHAFAQQAQAPAGPRPAAPKPKPAAAAAAPAAAPAAQGPRLLEKQGVWSIYVHDSPGEKICFATAAPSAVEPKGTKRGAVFFYLTTWRKDNVRAEVSVRLGYTIKADAAPQITVGAESFELFARGDKAFTRDPQEEKRLLDAMLKASALTVKGVSAKGSATTDHYSLNGLAVAMKKIDQNCQ